MSTNGRAVCDIEVLNAYRNNSEHAAHSARPVDIAVIEALLPSRRPVPFFRSITGSKRTDACGATGAKAHVNREGSTGDGGRQEMAISMRATWSTEVVKKSADVGGALAVEERLWATGAGKAMGAAADLIRIPVDGKERRSSRRMMSGLVESRLNFGRRNPIQRSSSSSSRRHRRRFCSNETFCTDLFDRG